MKGLGRKSQVDNVLDVADKNREKKKKSSVQFKFFSRQKLFGKYGIQNHFLFRPGFKYFKTPSAYSNQVIAWKSNWFSEESIKPPAKSSNSLSPWMTFFNSAKIKVKFDVGSLKQEKLTFHNVYFIYEINLWLKRQILTSIPILDILLDLLFVEFFHCQMVVDDNIDSDDIWSW